MPVNEPSQGAEGSGSTDGNPGLDKSQVDKGKNQEESTLTKLSKPVWLTVPVITVFVVARVSLIVQAFVALRDLPPDAFVDVQWNKFIPHLLQINLKNSRR